jgi:four helix bundle protein
MRDFREIKVWAKAHALTVEIYKVTAEFPREEMYGLTSQLRRSSASVPANIAEGFGR